ncbi:hypothetical protein F5Y15DRAFT_423192 [Xylariaceae sp. FL0016]|nr:hypothetical protein F5Y15DRAFT_423192 [Xylariaceae sp. FL0016]
MPPQPQSQPLAASDLSTTADPADPTDPTTILASYRFPQQHQRYPSQYHRSNPSHSSYYTSPTTTNSPTTPFSRFATNNGSGNTGSGHSNAYTYNRTRTGSTRSEYNSDLSVVQANAFPDSARVRVNANIHGGSNSTGTSNNFHYNQKRRQVSNESNSGRNGSVTNDLYGYYRGDDVESVIVDADGGDGIVIPSQLQLSDPNPDPGQVRAATTALSTARANAIATYQALEAYHTTSSEDSSAARRVGTGPNIEAVQSQSHAHNSNLHNLESSLSSSSPAGQGQGQNQPTFYGSTSRFPPHPHPQFRPSYGPGHGQGQGQGHSQGHPRTASSSSASAPPRTSSLLPPPRSTTNSRNVVSPIHIPTLNNSSSTLIPFSAPSTANNATASPAQQSSLNVDRPQTQAAHAHSLQAQTPAPTDFDSDAATFLLDPLNTPGLPVPVQLPLPPTTFSSNTASTRRHSRASSIGAVSEGFRNLHRWSSSTTSSRVSAWDHHLHQPPSHQQLSSPQQSPQQQRSTNFSRRMSVDSVALLAQQSGPNHSNPSPPTQPSPRNRLSKRRPSADAGASPKARVGGGFGSGTTTRSRRQSSPPPAPPSVPPPNLPPIVSLSPLTADPDSSLRVESSRVMNRASPGLSTPNLVFSSQNNGEPQDYFWNDLSNPSRTGSPVATRANPNLLPPASVARDNMPEKKGHTRSRSSNAKSSGDSTKKDRASKPSQKAMLSKALSKANAAVQLDNAQKYVAARDSYLEACDLLHQVLARTNGEEDRKKLEAIRQTYSSRIEELDGLVPTKSQADKALPSRPDSVDYHGVQIELAGADSRGGSPRNMSRRPSQPQVIDFSRTAASTPGPDSYPLQSSFSKSPMRRNFQGTLNIPRPDDSVMPAPLSPRRPLSPAKAPSPEPIVRQDFSLASDRLSVSNDRRGHRRNLSHESASWLDPIDESGGSAASSVHSRSSSFQLRRKHLRSTSGDTEAEFDAALDAAVEAAYDDGYEPMGPADMMYDDNDTEDRVANTMRRVELARERVRQTEREAAIELAREQERQRQRSIGQESQILTFGGDFFDANDSDEEERMLEEMTKGYVMEDFAMGSQSQHQSNVPRESDSSGLTTRTWHSSMGSNPASATTLSTVTEMPPPPKQTPPSMPPPPHSLPQPPLGRPSSASGVRTRRLSGQNTKQLKIDTSKVGQAPIGQAAGATSVIQGKSTGSFIAQQRQAISATSTRPGPFSMRVPSSPSRGVSPANAYGPTSPPDENEEFRTGSPTSVRGGMRKNFSSNSLKSLGKSRQLSVSQIDDGDLSPNTPLTHQVSNTSLSRQTTMPALPTPLAAAFSEKTSGFGGLHLFDSDFHSPIAHSPSSLHQFQQQNPEIPISLEPCPSDAMLRPFWLMRALYQTLAHPRGGYISNKLFVPRDAWKVKGVKLKALDDKVSQCDLLTAALLKLARVDSNDADAVLEEMQSFENILETVQVSLIRRLGTEVGSQGVSIFRDEKESESVPAVPRNNSVSGKSGAFSWRRLRGKGSAVNLSSAYGGKSSSSGSNGPSINERETISSIGSIPSLPMTAHPSNRPAKRDVASVKFDGPYANYTASLARLFDAAQTVDQIARQVEDPGLRHADKTQVGLELCTRHAAEFFAFYICRFVLADLGMLLDKFVKRGSEWVLN